MVSALQELSGKWGHQHQQVLCRLCCDGVNSGHGQDPRERELLQNEEEGKESFPGREHGRMTRMLAQGSGVDSRDSICKGVENTKPARVRT